MKLEDWKRRKRELGYTNEKLSELSGVPLSTVQKIFSGITKAPRYTTVQALDSVLGTGRTWRPDAYAGASFARETSSAYDAGHWKRQGEYTLEDYYALPDEQRVELIDGVFYDMTAPSSLHQLIAGELYYQLKSFIRENSKDCLPFIAPFDVQLDCDDRTMVEPDVIVVCHLERLTRKRLHGAPDFAAEVLSPSTRKKDMSLKRNKYEAAGVREYWIIDPDREKVIVYLFGREPDINIYGLRQQIPVALTNGECRIDFTTVLDEMQAYGLISGEGDGQPENQEE